MNQTLIKNVNIWTMDEEDTRFYGWVLLENGKIASMGEGEPPAMPVQIDGDVVYGEGGVLTPGLIDIHSHIGLYEDGLGFEGADGNEDTDRRRRTCVHWTASTRSTAASARHLRPV
ncbi:MAG: hypothetical protein ACLUI6_09460 [Butyricicoccus sp.]